MKSEGRLKRLNSKVRNHDGQDTRSKEEVSPHFSYTMLGTFNNLI